MFIVILVFVLGSTFFSLDAKFDTLQEWATECFTNYKEYNEQLYKTNFYGFVEGEYKVIDPKILSFEDFNKILNTFNSEMQKSLEPYIQKIKVDTNSKICFMGDIHGSLHSLLRNLLRLVALGYLKNDFSISENPENKKFYIVFLGDYVDRGRYSVEVIYTLLKLKLKNMDKVFLLRGNHEIASMYGGSAPTSGLYFGYGFTKEVYDKFKDKHTTDEIKALMQTFDTFCNQLSLALFIGSGDSWIQCNHGGIEPTFKREDLSTFLSDANSIFSLKNKLYQEPMDKAATSFKGDFHQIDSDNGFTWCDFDNTSGNDGLSYARGRGYKVSGAGATLRDYLNNYKLQAIFRGHQHSNYGLKIDGEVHWEDFKQNTLNLFAKAKAKDGFKVSEIDYPVFTFSTASEGVELPYDCFGILTTAEKWEDWRLLPYEFELPKDRNRKYITIKTFKTPVANLEDPIEFYFGDKPASQPLLVTIPEAEPEKKSSVETEPASQPLLVTIPEAEPEKKSSVETKP